VIAPRSGAKRILRLVVLAVAVSGAAWFFLREPSSETRLRRLLEDARRPDRVRPLLAQVPHESRITAMGVFAHAAREDRQAAMLHRDGLASFAAGDRGKALSYFRLAVDREPRAEWWNDVAAAELEVADRTKDAERYVTALEASDKALALDPELTEAHFNRALIVERLGFERASIPIWKEFVRLDPGAPWAELVRRHIARLTSKRTAREEWSDALERIGSITPAQLDGLIAAYPQEARLWGETMFLTRWAKGRQPVDLDTARTIGNRLASRSGERFLAAAVHAIDDPRCSDTLAAAYTAYIGARYEFKGRVFYASTRHFTAARARFAACRSPMAAVCDLYLAMTAIETNRIREARASLTSLLERERGTDGHYALVAQIEYQLALSTAMLGDFGDALTIATRSRDGFQRLGERGNAGTSAMLVGDLLAILGQPQPAWRHQIDAAAALSFAGQWEQLQACVSAMNQIELHRHRWSAARAISGIETALGRDPMFLADAHLRNGFAAAEEGDVVTARLLLGKATVTAANVADPDIREKLIADIRAVQGRMSATSDPPTAIASLTPSIEFQQRSGRAFALPDLYLSRGRAHLALGARSAALADFESGIRALEAQRSRIRDYELRTGVFDDARALFPEAVRASLGGEDVAGAFAYLERGRARALLDELSDDAEVPLLSPLGIVQQNLEPRTLLVSYALLPDRVAIFVIDHEHANVRFSDVKADEVAIRAKELAHALRERNDIAAPSAKLFDELLLPIAAELAAATRLIIVPDVSLEQMPFAALLDRRTGKFLADTHELTIEPSAAVYLACKRRSATINRESSIALFLNPKTSSFSDLPAAEREAPRVAQRYSTALVRSRDTATAATFRDQASQYGIVQFSGHAVIDRGEPWTSALMFDAPLTAREIGAIRFSRTRLVILAACSTLAFDRERVEGTSAIARAFLTAGVPTVIGSLWDVDDDDAAAFMVRLHERLARGVAPAAALRDVQREFIHDRTRHDPGAWAAFTVIGQP